MSGSTVLGIDVGGTKTALALVELPTGGITARRTIATPAATGEDFLDAVEQTAGELAAGHPVSAIGLGLCELVGLAGEVESGHRVRWQGVTVRERLSRLAPATIVSDVHAAALAEARLGAGRGFASLLYVNIGTGISSALVLDGIVHRGANGHALVLASSPTAFRCPSCGERHESILEDVAGGAALAALKAAKPDDPRIIEDAAAALAGTLATVLGVLDPQALVIGGGIGSANGAYVQALIGEVRARIWSSQTRKLAIMQAALGPDAGLIGAALAAADPAAERNV